MSRRGWVLFGAMCLIWGVPYLLIKVAVGELEPTTLVLGRTGIGAAMLLPVAFARGQVRPVLARWRPLLAFAVVEMAVPWVLLGFAEQRLSSSVTGLLLAAIPLVAAALARYGPKKERLAARRLVGLLVGIGGVAALVGFEVGGNVVAVLALAVVVLGYALGPVILDRWLTGVPSLGVVSLALAACAVIYLPAGLIQAPVHWPAAKVTWSVVGLAVLCTAIAFLVFFALIAEVGPVRATVITYVNPAVAVLLGVLVLDERFTVATGVGFVLILAGSVLATARGRSAPESAGPELAAPPEPASAALTDPDCTGSPPAGAGGPAGVPRLEAGSA
jgi:drug/metabolite transporter (DMT)-like permease